MCTSLTALGQTCRNSLSPLLAGSMQLSGGLRLSTLQSLKGSRPSMSRLICCCMFSRDFHLRCSHIQYSCLLPPGKTVLNIMLTWNMKRQTQQTLRPVEGSFCWILTFKYCVKEHQPWNILMCFYNSRLIWHSCSWKGFPFFFFLHVFIKG